MVVSSETSQAASDEATGQSGLKYEKGKVLL